MEWLTEFCHSANVAKKLKSFVRWMTHEDRSYELHDDFLTEFRQPLQVQSHIEMPGNLVHLGCIQHTKKIAPQIELKWSPTWSLIRHQAICPLRGCDRRYVC